MNTIEYMREDLPIRLLIITQVVDADHSVLGFMVDWIKYITTYVSSIRVITLQLGKHDIATPIDSLKKECGYGWLSKLFRLYYLVVRDRHLYDVVFVHMNEEYVLACGMLWRMLGKRIILWRNHPSGNWKTALAAKLSHVLCYTSPQSFIARYPHAQKMPAGIVLTQEDHPSAREATTILMAGRINEWYKQNHLFIEGLLHLKEQAPHLHWKALLIGDPDIGQEAYYDKMKHLVQSAGLSDQIRFHSGLPLKGIQDMYRESGIIVNLTQAGNLDKTLLEAMALGCLPLTTNPAFRGTIHNRYLLSHPTPIIIAQGIAHVLSSSEEDRAQWRSESVTYAITHHSINTLMRKLIVLFQEQVVHRSK